MIEMNINEVSKAVEGKIIHKGKAVCITGVSIDSRTIQKNNLFIAIIGEKLDGHKYIKEAGNRGASAVIVDRKVELEGSISVIKVDDTTKALQNLAGYYRKKMNNLKVIAITGSAGKTSTKDITAKLLTKKYYTKKTTGNLNNYYGLPLTLLDMDKKQEIAVLEMGMSELGEIDLLSKISDPDVGIITNVGATHLESLGNIANVARGKSELISNLKETGTAILNYDNKYVRKMKDVFNGRQILYYGLSPEADIRACEIEDEDDGKTNFTVEFKGEKRKVTINKPGRHFIYNSLAAVAAARIMDVSWKDISTSLADVKFSALRWDVRIIAKNIKLINDSYNANPLSMKAAVDTISKIKKSKRTIAVLGAMLELGKSEKRAHIELGNYIAQKSINILVTVGKIGAYIAKGALEAGMDSENIYILDNNRKASWELKKILRKNDVVLIKGSRGNKMEEIVESLL